MCWYRNNIHKSTKLFQNWNKSKFIKIQFSNWVVIKKLILIWWNWNLNKFEVWSVFKNTMSSFFFFQIGHSSNVNTKYWVSVSSMRKMVLQNFSPQRKIQKSGISHMVTSNGSHPLHHHQIQTRRHSGRLLNSPFNGRTTMLQTFTQWHCSSPPSGLTGYLLLPQQTEYCQIWLYTFWASGQNPLKPKKQKTYFYICWNHVGH